MLPGRRPWPLWRSTMLPGRRPWPLRCHHRGSSSHLAHSPAPVSLTGADQTVGDGAALRGRLPAATRCGRTTAGHRERASVRGAPRLTRHLRRGKPRRWPWPSHDAGAEQRVPDGSQPRGGTGAHRAVAPPPTTCLDSTSASCPPRRRPGAAPPNVHIQALRSSNSLPQTGTREEPDSRMICVTSTAPVPRMHIKAADVDPRRALSGTRRADPAIRPRLR